MDVITQKSRAAVDRIFAAHHIVRWGATPAAQSSTRSSLQQWIAAGMHGTMQWMAREDTVAKRQDISRIVPWVRSVISCAIQYTPPQIPAHLLNDPSRGIIARYALFDDYHDVLLRELTLCAEEIATLYPGMQYRVYVDTGPVLEREWAHAAGLGFVGRNSNIIDWSLGSYLFLCEILVSAELPALPMRSIGSCGHCTACMQQCPTKAIIADKTVDARKCISYLTIEHKGSIPEEMRPLIGNRIYGCDICQEVCPWNRKPVPDAVWMQLLHFHADRVAPKLSELLFFSDESFNTWAQGSAMKRVKRERFMRNIAVALGNWGTPEARTLIEEVLLTDSSELVQEHARWAMQRCL